MPATSGSRYRYFAIVHPLRYFGWKRALAPLSILVAVAYNVPKFFEFRYDLEEGRIIQSTLRSNPVYITYYIFWSKFILVEIIPYFTIIVLNSLIMGKIYKSTRFQNRFRYQSTIRGRQKHSGEVSLNPVVLISSEVPRVGVSYTLHYLLGLLVNRHFQANRLQLSFFSSHAKGIERPEGNRGSIKPKASLRRLQSTNLDTCEEDGESEAKKGLERRRKQLLVGDGAAASATTTFCASEDK